VFCTSGLGSEAKGLIEEINAKHPSLIRAFTPADIVELLVNAGYLSRPRRHDTPFPRFSNESILAVLETGLVWIETPTDPNTGERQGLVAYTQDGIPITNPAHLPDFRGTDFRLREFDWIPVDANPVAPNRPIPHQSIVRVMPGEDWSDFRPSRPSDFVGREHTILSINSFLESVSARRTNTRIFGIKGRSGWGKSSILLKIADHYRQMLAPLAYVLPVDCRSAQNFNFPDLAVRKALKDAYADGFLLPLFRQEYESVRNPFESEAYRAAIQELDGSARLLVIVFDQFEEIIHRSDLSGAFQRFAEIAYAADELSSNIVLGFSWKTDGTTSTDNPGYQLWHSFSDRRRDFEVTPFTRDEAEEFLRHASASAGTPVSRDAKRFMLEQYSGFPWLLKKLFVNYVETQGKPKNENRYSPDELDIAKLFDADLLELSEAEHSAIRFVAENAPIEIYRVSDRYSVKTANSLLSRRLIIQSGDAVLPYWDIFREYILTRRIPFVPLTYVPTLSGRKLVSALRLLSGFQQCTYDQLADRMKMSIHTADNVVRDLTNMGLIAPHRLEGFFEVFDLSGEEATRRIVDFVRRHAIFQQIELVVAKTQSFALASIFDKVAESYSFISPSTKTLETYIKKIVNLSANVGLIRREGGQFVIGAPIQDIMKINIARKALIDTEVFRAHAPPSQVAHLLEWLQNGPRSLSEVRARKLRNAAFAANALGLAVTENDTVAARTVSTHDIVGAIVAAAGNQETINFAIERLRETPGLQGREIGEEISDMFQLDWSPGSCSRYGTGLRTWATWIIEHR
jgi:hypothetical protein